MKKLTAIIPMFILWGIAMAQTEPKQCNQLLSVLKTSGQDTTRLAALIALAQCYEDRPSVALKFDSARIYLDQARRLNKVLKITHFQNAINILAAKIKCDENPKIDVKSVFLPVIQECKVTGDFRNQLSGLLAMTKKMPDDPHYYQFWQTCYDSALALSRKINDEYYKLAILKDMADVHLRQNLLEPAEEELLQIISNPKATHSQLLAAYDELTDVYTTKGHYDKALFYGFKTLNTMRTAEDSLSAVTFYGRLRLIYSNLGDPTKSNIWAKKAFGYLSQNKQYELMPFVRESITSNLIKEGKPREALNFLLTHNLLDKIRTPEAVITYRKQLGDCYYALKNYAAAEKNYLELLHLISKKDVGLPTVNEAVYYQVIGKFYINIHREIRAKPYLLRALKDLKTVRYVSSLKDNYLLLFKADSAAGHLQSAIKYLQLGNRLKDSIFNSEKSKQIEELQIAYNIEQKDKNINSLKNSAKLQTLNLAHAKSTRNWTIIGSTLLVLIAILFYRQAKTTRKTNKEVTRKNRLLEQLVVEKEWLLKEVHHRVKNNLHTVICLLESQAKYLEDDALKAVESSQHRIFAMSLIHQKLYRTDNIKSIDMTEYIPELVNNLKASFAISDLVDVTFNVEKITLNISYAIPIGLIINEAVTNAIKHAFPGNAVGKICIGLIDDDNEITLSIFDNGIGFHGDPYCTQFQSMGIELMKGLTAEIDGHIKFEIAGGTRITVSFSPALPM